MDTLVAVWEWMNVNPGLTFFLGNFSFALLNTLVKLSPTKADDIILDILYRSFKAGWAEARDATSRKELEEASPPAQPAKRKVK